MLWEESGRVAVSSAFQFAGVIHWVSLVILSVFFSETVLRIVVLGIWDYIENKIEVFDGAVITLSLAPMVASTVANGPRSPWDAISLLIVLRIWRVKRVIDAYVLPVKVQMGMVIQQYEKAKGIQDEQLERLTQICQEQGFEIRQLRAHLAQQGLDLAAEREAALRTPQVLGRPRSRYPEDTAGRGVVEALQPPAGTGIPEPTACVVTTAAIDIHQPHVTSEACSVDVAMKLGASSHPTPSPVTRAQSSSADCSATHEDASCSQPLTSAPTPAAARGRPGPGPAASPGPGHQRSPVPRQAVPEAGARWSAA